MDPGAFVAAQVAHRLGDLGTLPPSLSVAARDHALSMASNGAIAWDCSGQLPYPANGWASPPGAPHKLKTHTPGVKQYKFRDTLLSLLAAGLDFDTVVDMEDRRVRSLATAEGVLFPTISFNRTNTAQGRILWHMPGPLHRIGAPEFLGPFPDPTALPFHERIPQLVWRGAPNGRSASDGPPIAEKFRLNRIIGDVEKGRRDLAWAEAQLQQFPRVRFVRHLSGHPAADVGLVAGDSLPPLARTLLGPFLAAPMAQRQQARFRYIAVLRGADLASSFFWTMNSGSLALVMDSPWESFASIHFRPWEHYVPFRQDMSDLDERLEWCADNPADCAAMVAAAGEVCQLLMRQDLRDQADRAVIDGLRARINGQA